MATITIDRPYICFGDDGYLKAFDDQGNEMKPDPRNLGKILAEKQAGAEMNTPMDMEIETIRILKVNNNCCRWVWIDPDGWVCFPC
jgi:hypothetical protein